MILIPFIWDAIITVLKIFVWKINFLTFVRENNPTESKDYHDSYVSQLQNSIFQIKQNRELGSRYMLLELMLRDEYKKGILEGKAEGRAEGIAEGISEGIAKGKAESILFFLEAYGSVSDELRTFILSQTDNSILTNMLQKAASCHSIEQFMEAISFTSVK